MSMTDPPAVDKRARRYQCCEHCDAYHPELPDAHPEPCDEADCEQGKQYVGGAE